MPWWIPFTAGLEDGLNPCALVTCAVVLVLNLWLERKGINPRRFLIVFIISMFVVNMALNLGFWMAILSGRIFVKTAAFIYVVLGLVSAAAGAVFLYDWVLLLKGKDPQNLLSGRIFYSKAASKKRWLVYGVVIAAAVMMSILSSVWPANYYMTIFSNNLYLPGRFWSTAGFLALYTLVQIWLIVFLAILFCWDRLTPRLRQVMSAAVFLSAAAAVIYVF